MCKLLRTNLPIISKGLSWKTLYLRYIKGFLCKHTPRTWDGNIFPAAVGKHLMFLQQWLPAWTPGTCKMSVKCVYLSLQQYLCQKCSSKRVLFTGDSRYVQIDFRFIESQSRRAGTALVELWVSSKTWRTSRLWRVEFKEIPMPEKLPD